MTHLFSAEHLEKLKQQLDFKREVLEHINTTVHTPDGNVDLYKQQLVHADVIEQLELEISQLEWSISMLETYLEVKHGTPTDPV